MVRKSTIPEWAVARGRLTVESGDSEMHDLLFISYILASETPVRYAALNDTERTVADRLLKMGVIDRSDGLRSRYLELTEPWRRAFESRWKDKAAGRRTTKKKARRTKAL